jgi:hypothetical protein
MDKELRDLERAILSGDVARLPEYVHNQERLGKTQTIYIVVSDSFAYNDNYYYQSEGGGGEPVRAFLSETAARQEANRLSIGWLHQESEELYAWAGGENLEYLFQNVEGELTDFLSQHGASMHGEEGIDVSNCTDEQCIKIIENIEITPYSIRSITLEDGMCSPDEILSFCAGGARETEAAEEGAEPAAEDEDEDDV